jgi:Ca-activated chloride channel family protein
MTFIWPWMLVSLLLVPLFAWLYVGFYRRRLWSATTLAAMTTVKHGNRSRLGMRRHLPPAIYLLGLSLLLFGLARPEAEVSLPRIEGTVILAFDVSNSMTADDLEPTRMEAAKSAARLFSESQPATVDIGVVAFSSGGLVVQQPTSDRSAVLSTIDRLTPQGGTSLAQGIFSSINAIAGRPISIDPESLSQGEASAQLGTHSSAVIVLLSDGENTGPPEPLEVAQIAADASIRIYTVGVGTPEGAVLNIDGFNIMSQLNEASLKEIASLTNGEYFRAADKDALLEVYDSIDLRLTIDGERTEVTSLLAGIGALILLIAGFLSLFWFGRIP